MTTCRACRRSWCSCRTGSTASMLEIVFGTIGLIGLAVALLWLIGLPADEEVEELAGLVTGNWDEVETRIDGR
jgi:hypothetical protein